MNTTTAKPTPGPWHTEQDRYIVAVNGMTVCRMSYFPKDGDLLNLQPAHAALIAEAGTVYHETGLTPRQLADEVMDLGRRIAETQAELSRIYAARGALADQRAELLAALERLTDECEAEFTLDGMWSDNGQIVVHTTYTKARAAIARAKAVPK